MVGLLDDFRGNIQGQYRVMLGHQKGGADKARISLLPVFWQSAEPAAALRPKCPMPAPDGAGNDQQLLRVGTAGF